jgi:hypothetical protein
MDLMSGKPFDILKRAYFAYIAVVSFLPFLFHDEENQKSDMVLFQCCGFSRFNYFNKCPNNQTSIEFAIAERFEVGKHRNQNTDFRQNKAQDESQPSALSLHII